MRLPSITTTNIADFVSIETRPSFRNQVRAGLWKGNRAYKKIYPEREYWETEMLVLNLLADHPHITIPAIYAADESSLSVVMSELPGEKLQQVDVQLVQDLATVLRILHQEQGARELTRVDMGARLQLFDSNIIAASCLSLEEKQLASQTMKVLQAELVPATLQATDLVHGDFNLGNVLRERSQVGKNLGVIDFERSHRGLGLVDVAKGAWRILNNQTEAVDLLLHAYYGHIPSREERRLFSLVSASEYLGAISYFALEGHANGYPYKDEAFTNLKKCL